MRLWQAAPDVRIQEINKHLISESLLFLFSVSIIWLAPLSNDFKLDSARVVLFILNDFSLNC